MRPSVKLFLILFLCLASYPAACVETDTAKFLKNFDAAADKVRGLEYLSGFESGIGWANAALTQRHDRPLYCVPATLSLTPDQILQILRDELEKVPKLATSPVGMTLLYGLKETFPCPDSK